MKKFIKAKLKDDLLRHSGILFMTSGLAGFCNFLFQIFMNHALLPSQFSALYALVTITVISSIPGMSIQTLMTKQISHLKAKNQFREARSLILYFLSRIVLMSGIVLAVLLLLSSNIDSFLKIHDTGLIVITAFVICLAFVLPVGYGILQGLQHFAALGFSMAFFSLSRLILALALVIILKWGVAGALSSSIFAFIVTMVLIFFILRKELNVYDHKPHSFEAIDNYAWVLLISFTFAFLLTFIDILLVKHFFSPAESAQYSSASVLGRAVFYIPWAISGAMFPKVSHAYARGELTQPLLKKSLAYAFLLSLVPAICFLIIPRFFLSILKSDYLGVDYLLRAFGVAFIPFALLTVLVYYNLAIHNNKMVYVLGVSSLFHLLVLNFFHGSLLQVIIAMGLSSLAILSAVFAFTCRYLKSGVFSAVRS